MKQSLAAVVGAVFAAWLGMVGAGAARGDDRQVEFFETKIRPALVEHCYQCHSAESRKQRGGLSLDTKGALLKGGDRGPVLVAGMPGESFLVKALRQAMQDLKMPPSGKLPRRSPFRAVDRRRSVRSARWQDGQAEGD